MHTETGFTSVVQSLSFENQGEPQEVPWCMARLFHVLELTTVKVYTPLALCIPDIHINIPDVSPWQK